MADLEYGVTRNPEFPGILSGYQTTGTSDIFTGAPPDVVEKWLHVANGLAELCDGALGDIHARLAHEVDELGTTFRPIGDPDERSWPLSPMPLLIGTEEWEGLTKGLIQRASLLELVVADLYGNQDLVRDGHLPAVVLAGSPHFVRKMQGVAPASGRFLHVYAVDLARGPTGEWRVLADRVRLPTGIGYALENRLAVSRTTGTLLSDINARRLAEFFGDLKGGIAASCSRDDPRMALLTSGRFNQSYAEQAHLARYLGFPLVEGRDLTVSDGRLYVRTIAGLKRIDAVWRWIGANMLDPLSFDALSQIGVPDMFDAWASGDLTVVNWPGVGVVEARAFSAFLPRLAQVLLGENLILPNMATWWCGQDDVRETVRRRIDELVVSSAFDTVVAGLEGGRTRAGASLSESEKVLLFDAIEKRPIDYVGQEIVHLSTTPALVGERFEPRPFTLRAYVARDLNGRWVVMPGGYARISSQGDLRTSLIGQGDYSVDVCIVDEVPVQQLSLLGPDKVPTLRRDRGLLASQAADNLFWFNRYGERAEMTTRIIRSLLGSSIEVDGGSRRSQPSLGRLADLLVDWGVITLATAELPLPQLCSRAFRENKLAGGIETLVHSMRGIGLSLRDRMANDLWRIANQPVPQVDQNRAQSVLSASNVMIDRFGALSGLAAENMGRGPGWRFFDLGRRIERALNLCKITRQLAGNGTGQDDLGLLLDLFDSQITYRTRYLVGPQRGPVMDLLLLDPQNPRGLIYQIERIEEHLANLPHLDESGLPDAPFRQISVIRAQLLGMESQTLGDADLSGIEARLLSVSDAISQRYFLQFEPSKKDAQDSLLA